MNNIKTSAKQCKTLRHVMNYWHLTCVYAMALCNTLLSFPTVAMHMALCPTLVSTLMVLCTALTNIQDTGTLENCGTHR